MTADVKYLQALLEKARPRPWTIEGEGTASVRAETVGGTVVLGPVHWQRQPELELAVAAVNALPDLLRALSMQPAPDTADARSGQVEK